MIGAVTHLQPPTLTLLEIGDLSLDRFRGILRLGYSGDAWLEVRCRVQVRHTICSSQSAKDRQTLCHIIQISIMHLPFLSRLLCLLRNPS